ncbi:MAG: 3D domain-containing protein [Desulfobacterales bacterium]|nr:3D domain-containing protein [Desulfobacterales bacterium]
MRWPWYVACLILASLEAFVLWPGAKVQPSCAQQRLNEKLVRRVLAIEKTMIKQAKRVTVTAYTPRAAETDSTPELTAIQRRVKPGTVAVSPDLLAQGWTFGRKVYIEGIGVLVIGDLMHPKWTDSMDVLLFDLKAAREFGRQENLLAVLLLEAT